MAKRKSYNLYYKGRKLIKPLKDIVKETAKQKNIDISNEKALYEFYTAKKNLFEDFFEGGTTSVYQGADSIIEDIDKAKNTGKRFFIQRGDSDELTPISAKDLKYELVMTEQWINGLLDTSAFMQKYRLTYDGKFIIKLPVREREPEWADEDSETISDELEQYDILVYEPTSSSDKRKKYYDKKRKERKRKYSKKTNRKKKSGGKRRK